MDATTFAAALDMKDVATAIVFCIGVIAPALAIGKIGSEALSAIGRNPSAAKEARATMILAIAFAEALGIFAFVMALIIKFL